ncbi:MAG TPA: RtcB family protein [Actinomycetota bacterium]|jgi:RNA-splicing ligase RtcB|nr:RtcB family protein [Actinomycetota bacterium]
MGAKRISDKLVSWASQLDEVTISQALRSSRLPVVSGHIALMADAHFGLGATVGSVIPTTSALIPAAVGVDIGCGMIAAQTDLPASHLPDDLKPLLGTLEKKIPSGVGEGHKEPLPEAERWLAAHRPHSILTERQVQKTLTQFGTLGSGNHFFEVCLDESDTVWVVLHSGSRGIGNQLAQGYIKTAQKYVKALEISLEDKDLAYLDEGTPEFTAYLADLTWAQDYARANRDAMMDAGLAALFKFAGRGRTRRRINCHHNYTAREEHFGREMWITRKGAIKAGPDDLGVIPGSMGTRSYIVRGKGNPESYNSCSHGAGRAMSRTAARKQFKGADLAKAMQGKTWQSGDASALVDEIPQAYKDIDQVMADQQDLVEVQHTLRQILNYKGVR